MRTSIEVANSIFEAIEKGDEEIVPTITGKILEKTFKHVPDIFRFSGRALISKFLKTSSKKKASKIIRLANYEIIKP